MTNYLFKRAVTLKYTLEKFKVPIPEFCRLYGISKSSFYDWCNPNGSGQVSNITKEKLRNGFLERAKDIIKEKHGVHLKKNLFIKKFNKIMEGSPEILIDYLDGRNAAPNIFLILQIIHGDPTWIKKSDKNNKPNPYYDLIFNRASEIYDFDKVQFSPRGFRGFVEGAVFYHGEEARKIILDSGLFRDHDGELEPNSLLYSAKVLSGLYNELNDHGLGVDTKNQEQMRVVAKAYIHYNQDMFRKAFSTNCLAPGRKDLIEPFITSIETASSFDTYMSVKMASITQKFVHERSFLDPNYYSDSFHPYFCDIIPYIGRLFLDMDIDRPLKITHEKEHCCSHNPSLNHCKYYFDESLYDILFKSKSKSLTGRLDAVLERHDYVRMEGQY